MPAPNAEVPSEPGPSSGALVTDKRLRAVCRLALDVVRAGELADPRVPAPHSLHKVLSFQRLSGTAYEAVARALDDDPAVRARVAAEADKAAVGQAGWLWLHRPAGWATDPAWLDDTAPVDGVRPTMAKVKAETELARRRREADEARSAQRSARKEVAEARRETAIARAEAAEMQGRLASLSDERNRAVRTAKTTEAELAEARRRLKLAKEAAIDAETELATLRASSITAPGSVTASAVGSSVSGPGPTSRPNSQPPNPPGPAIDAATASAAVAAAATAAAELGAALARAAVALEPKETPVSTNSAALVGTSRDPAAADAGSGSRTGGRGSGGRRHRRAHRATAPLPPGMFDGTAEANRHLISAGDALVVVDGYNLARSTWADLTPREDRQRVVSLLEAVQARSGGVVIVVFDGESGTVAPRHSRAVRVIFSDTGVTADDHIADLVRSVPLDRPVVVVSSDRAVMTEAEDHGATALSSPAFLTAAGR